MKECEIQIIRPTSVTGDDLYGLFSRTEILFQFLQRPDSQLVILCKSAEKAVAAVHTEPDRIAGEQILIVNEINHMPPSMAWDQDTLDFDVTDVNDLSVFQKDLLIVSFDQRELI